MKSTDNPFINRELSWLEFNARVLQEATRTDVPLFERLRFICIVANNFDEFFMVRVAAVKRQIADGDYVQCPSGIKPSELLQRIIARTREIIATSYATLHGGLFPALADHGIVLKRPGDYTAHQKSLLQKLFRHEVFPVITPVRAVFGEPLPYVTNLRLHAAFILEPSADAETMPTEAEEPGERLAIVQIPHSLDRIIFLPDEAGIRSFALLEDVVADHAAALFPGYTVKHHCLFRVTRDADLGVDEERDEDFVEAMEQLLESREFSDAVRLTISEGAGRLTEVLSSALRISSEEVFEVPQPLDLAGLNTLCSVPGFAELVYDRWQPCDSPLVTEEESLWDLLLRRDVLLHHPFESFEPVTRLLTLAAEDPDVLAIKMTLYRTSGDSPIVRALERAARNGKQVSVLVELKARFDEERNISWAESLERAGVIVVYGLARLKVHAKAMLIIRRGSSGIDRFVHLGTGNYNDRTARIYTDIGLLTSRSDIAYEAALFFNAITGYSAIPALRKLVMAPVALKPKLLQLIERETLRARSGEQASIVAKLNSVADPDVICALYEASTAGVEIKLNVRGICMLVPGVPGKSENITVVSIIDRYLEHARIYSFRNGGAVEIYGASADWMVRNLERRVELMFPIEDETARSRVEAILETTFDDNMRSHIMQSDGSYQPSTLSRNRKVRSQIEFQRLASEASAVDQGDRTTFTVRRPPKE
jgi:polyphosphate kinase